MKPNEDELIPCLPGGGLATFLADLAWECDEREAGVAGAPSSEPMSEEQRTRILGKIEKARAEMETNAVKSLRFIDHDAYARLIQRLDKFLGDAAGPVRKVLVAETKELNRRKTREAAASILYHDMQTAYGGRVFALLQDELARLMTAHNAATCDDLERTLAFNEELDEMFGPERQS